MFTNKLTHIGLNRNNGQILILNSTLTIIMEVINKYINIILGAIVNIIVFVFILYINIHLFIAFAQAAFELSPLTGIGFIINILFAIYKGTISLDSLTYIFAASLLSFAAGTLIPNVVGNFLAGQIVVALIYLMLMIILWIKAQELKG